MPGTAPLACIGLGLLTRTRCRPATPAAPAALEGVIAKLVGGEPSTRPPHTAVARQRDHAMAWHDLVKLFPSEAHAALNTAQASIDSWTARLANDLAQSRGLYRDDLRRR